MPSRWFGGQSFAFGERGGDKLIIIGIKEVVYYRVGYVGNKYEGGGHIIQANFHLFDAIKQFFSYRERDKYKSFVAKPELYVEWQTTPKFKVENQVFVWFGVCLKALCCKNKGSQLQFDHMFL